MGGQLERDTDLIIFILMPVFRTEVVPPLFLKSAGATLVIEYDFVLSGCVVAWACPTLKNTERAPT